MHRPAVAADVERRAVDQRAQLGEREVAAVPGHAADRVAGSCSRASAITRVRGLALGRSRRDDHAVVSAPRERGRPRPRRTTRPASAGTDCRRSRASRRGDRLAATPARCQARGDARQRRRVDGISTGIASRDRRRDAERLEQIPLVLDRVPRAQRRAAGRPRCVYIQRAAGESRSRSARRAAQPGEQRGARPAVKIDGEVVAARGAAAGRAPGRAPSPASPARREARR